MVYYGILMLCTSFFAKKSPPAVGQASIPEVHNFFMLSHYHHRKRVDISIQIIYHCNDSTDLPGSQTGILLENA